MKLSSLSEHGKKQKHPASYLGYGVFYVPTILVECGYLSH